MKPIAVVPTDADNITNTASSKGKKKTPSKCAAIPASEKVYEMPAGNTVRYVS
jgi:hypothetical protein